MTDNNLKKQREQRLAQQLRANLLKRKAQSRVRTTDEKQKNDSESKAFKK